MEKHQIVIITALLIASVVFFALPFINWITNLFKKTYKKPLVGGMLIFSLCLIASIWCLRYSVGLYNIILSNKEVKLTWFEEIFNSVAHALQTFSMDESYANYIVDGKKMLIEMFGKDAVWHKVYGIYASFLNFIAPIAGGAIIFEIIANIFPKIRVWLNSLVFWKEKCYFSELNVYSLALAKSLNTYYVKTLKNAKPVLIFADAHIDKDNEQDYELLLEAKRLGAICVRDDISHVYNKGFGKHNYYLNDETEFGNLQAFIDLAENTEYKYIKNSKIYLFVQSDAYVQVEKKVRLILEDKKTKFNEDKNNSKDDIPIIVPVHSYRNLVHNLFTEVPLYEPLIYKQDKQRLNVTILGNGIIGTEAFLSAYWIGQMMISDDKGGMSDCELNINIFSKDTKEEFWSKIEYINPEISKTTKKNNKILSYNSKGDTATNYCNVNYIRADVKSGGFLDIEGKNKDYLLDTDYFIVALGSDADNISIAEKLRCFIGKKHFESYSPTEGRQLDHTVIAYAVFDPELCDTLNKNKHDFNCTKSEADIYMHAFGSLEQVYSGENVFMSRSILWAEEIGNAYLKEQNRHNYIEDNKNRAVSEDKNYNHWSNLARAMHIKYKVFSLGWIKTSLFDYNEKDKEANHRENVKNACAQYKRIAINRDIENINEKDKERRTELENKKHCLAWLEHRRWNAFARTMGYQYTGELEKNLVLNKNHKNMPLKLHPCLVEAKRPVISDGDAENKYILAKFNKDGTVNIDSVFNEIDDSVYDCLDCVTYAWSNLVKKDNIEAKNKLIERKEDKIPFINAYDFKMYDYYYSEFEDYISLSQCSGLLDMSKDKLIKLCERKSISGAIKLDEPDVWFILKSSADKMLAKQKAK